MSARICRKNLTLLTNSIKIRLKIIIIARKMRKSTLVCYNFNSIWQRFWFPVGVFWESFKLLRHFSHISCETTPLTGTTRGTSTTARQPHADLKMHETKFRGSEIWAVLVNLCCVNLLESAVLELSIKPLENSILGFHPKYFITLFLSFCLFYFVHLPAIFV